MDKLIVTITGLGLIAGIYWFFFGKKEGDMEAKSAWEIIVDGGYKPATIKIPHGKPATITFIRKDSNSCLEEVIIEDFKIKEYLPLGKPVTVTIPTAKPGSFGIHCGMNMYHGRIEVA